MKNLMVHLRWWAGSVGKGSVVMRGTRRAGIPKWRWLRHGYAPRRYREVAGFPCPAAGGKPVRGMTREERRSEAVARRTVAGELGHGRVEVVAVYLAV